MTPAPLSRITIILHWVVAAALVGMIGFGTFISTLDSGASKTEWIQLHKSFGMIIAGVALARILWRRHEGFPSHIGKVEVWEFRLARGVQLGLLALSVLAPIAGILTSITYARSVKVFGFTLIPQLIETKSETLNALFSSMHEVVGVMLAVLVLAHLAGALRHHFVLKDDTLRRMLAMVPRR
jgi:cytochrome b561